jgi:hypothetical protein
MMIHEALSVSGTRKHYTKIDDQDRPCEYSKSSTKQQHGVAENLRPDLRDY